VILVATDGSDHALAAMREALELAARTGDELLVVTVWQELHAALGIPVSVEPEREAARERAARAVVLAEDVGLEPEVSIRHGRPGEQICSVARERDVRMIVVGSRGAGPVAGALLGSVSTYLIRHAPCPVLVVRTAADRIEQRTKELT
jgi:nucleotide-binding universal stress UspA family protein